MAATATQPQESPGTATATNGKRGPYKPEDKPRVVWTAEEKAEMIEAGAKLRRADWRIGDKKLFVRAMENTMPVHRQRNVASLPAASQTWFREGVAAAMEPMPLPHHEEPAEEPEAVVEEPEAVVEEPAQDLALESLDTMSLVAIAVAKDIIQRQKDAETIRDLSRQVQELHTRMTETSSASLTSRALLIRVLKDLAPEAITDVLGTIEPPARPPHVREISSANGVREPKPPKLKICVVGGAGGLGAAVVRECQGFANVTYEHMSKTAVRKGFAHFDHVICTRYCGHDAAQAARAALGRANVTVADMHGASDVIHKIRELAGIDAREPATVR